MVMSKEQEQELNENMEETAVEKHMQKERGSYSLHNHVILE